MCGFYSAVASVLLLLPPVEPGHQPMGKTCAGNAAAALRLHAPFRALWNAAWPEKCGYTAPPNISAYGIDTNGGPNSTREGVAVCTPGPSLPTNLGTGLYPSYDCFRYPFDEANCRPVNGGSPQLANLSAHLEAFKKDVVRLMPDPYAATAINLDWEKWNPTWAGTLQTGHWPQLCAPNGSCASNATRVHDCKYCKYYIYGAVARRLAKEANPSGTPEEIEMAAKAGWERDSVNFLVQTLKVGQALRPNARWGFWDFVPGGHVSVTADAGTTAALRPLWEAMDALYPSVYIPGVATGKVDAAYVAAKLEQSRKLADTHLKHGVPMPIYAYTMMEALSVRRSCLLRISSSSLCSPGFETAAARLKLTHTSSAGGGREGRSDADRRAVRGRVRSARTLRHRWAGDLRRIERRCQSGAMREYHSAYA